MLGRGEGGRDPGQLYFAGIHRVLVEDGYERLTLAALAQVLGCSGPALLKRFTSRQGLLLAYIRRCTAATEQHFATVTDDRSPLAALIASLQAVPGDGTPTPHAVTLPHLAGLVLDARTDLLLEAALRQHIELVTTETQRLVEAAIAAGELGQVESGQLTRRLLETLVGAALLNGSQGRSPEDSHAREPGAVVLDVLGPYQAGPCSG